MAGVVDPHIDAFEMMQRQAQNAIDLFRVPDVAGKRDGAIGITDAYAGSFGASCIAREQDHASSFRGNHFGDSLADSHRSARDHHYLACELIARVVFSATRQVKVRSSVVVAQFELRISQGYERKCPRFYQRAEGSPLPHSVVAKMPSEIQNEPLPASWSLPR